MPIQKNKSLRLPVVPQEFLSRTQKNELFMNILRSSRIFEEAIKRLDSEKHFKDSVQPEYPVILAACRDVAKKHGVKPGDPSFPKRVTAKVKDVLAAMGDEIQPEERRSILGKKGILNRAFAAAAAPANEAYGRDLLKRFLEENEVFTPLADALAQCSEGGQQPENMREMLLEATKRLAAIESLDLPEIKSVGEDWAEHEARLKFYRGRTIVGLRTGLNELDRRTLGLQGLTIFGARPGAGKTALGAIEVSLGICRHHKENNAVIIVVSLDMVYSDNCFSRLTTIRISG
jgi:hypothetical protein